MESLKEVLVDIAVTVLIIVAVVTPWSWAWWIVAIYTPVMLVLKILAVLSARSLKKLRRDVAEPPRKLLHLLYGVNVVALGFAGWWYLLAGWLLIWILSVVQERRTS